MSRTISRRQYDEDEESERIERMLRSQRRGDFLQDGERYRVPVHMMDARVVDTSGDGGLGLQRPGFRRVLDVSDESLRELRRETQEAYALRDREDAEAWRNPNNNPPSGANSTEFVGQREGDLVTVNGAPGRLRYNDEGDLIGVPDHPIGSRDTRTLNQIVQDHELRMREEYMQYDRDVMAAYKRP